MLAGSGPGGAAGASATEWTSCPRAGEVASINTWVRVDAVAAFVDPPGGVVTLSCGGIEISGTGRVSGEHLSFEPDRDLPMNSTCVVTVAPDLLLEGGQSLKPLSFSFSTAETPDTAYEIEPPRALADGGYDSGLVTDRRDVIAYWTWGDLYFAVSHDGGDTFAAPVRLKTQLESPYIDDVRVVLRNGKAHFFWRVLASSPGFAYYARLEDDLATLHGPDLFMPEGEDVDVVSVGMGSDGRDELRVAWNGPVLCGSSFCSPAYGVWSASSSNAGKDWVSHGRVEQLDGSSPEIAWTSSGFLSAWLTDEGVSVFDQDFVRIDTLSVSGGMPWPFQFKSAGFGNALLGWAEGPGIGVETFYLSRFVAGSFETPRAVLTEPDDHALDGAVRFAPTRTDRMAMLSCVGNVFGEVARSVSLSEDGVAFYGPQQLEFLLAASGDERGEDSFCPSIALDEDGRLHLLWRRGAADPFSPGASSAILYARGEPSTPCAL